MDKQNSSFTPSISLADSLNKRFSNKNNNNTSSNNTSNINNNFSLPPIDIPTILPNIQNNNSINNSISNNNNNNNQNINKPPRISFPQSYPTSLQDHLRNIKKTPQQKNINKSMAEILKEKQQEKLNQQATVNSSSQKDNQSTDNNNNNNISQITNPLPFVDASKPVGTGVVALARKRLNNSLQSHNKIEESPLQVNIGTSELAKAIVSSKRKQPDSLIQQHIKKKQKTSLNESPIFDLELEKTESIEILLQRYPAKTLTKSFSEEITKKQNYNCLSFPSLLDLCFKYFLSKLPITASLISKLTSDLSEKLLKYCLLNNPSKIVPGLATLFLSIPNLQSIQLNNGSHFAGFVLSDLIRTAIKSSPNISHFYFQNCNELDYIHLQLIANNFTIINTLDLGKCFKLTDKCLQDLWEHIDVSYLQYLSLKGCYLLSSNSIRSLIDCLDLRKSTLEYLDISYCQYIEDDIFSMLLKECPKLTSLQLDYTLGLTNNSLKDIAKYCKNLSYLSLNGHSVLDDITIAYIAKVCNDLFYLSLSHCYEITSIGIEYIAKSCINLTFLDVSHCSKVRNSAILLLAGHCKQLKILNLTNLSIDSLSVNPLISWCGNNITSLSLGSTEIEENTIDYILNFCPILQQLDISFCHKLSFQNILKITKLSTTLQKIILWGFTFSSEQTKQFLQINPQLIIERLSFDNECNNSLLEFKVK